MNKNLLFTFTEFTDSAFILLLRITCGIATLFHNWSLLGFVPLKALKGLSAQRMWHGASIETESSVRVGPAL